MNKSIFLLFIFLLLPWKLYAYHIPNSAILHKIPLTIDDKILLKNPDGTAIRYCKPYIIQRNKKYPVTLYFTFSSHFNYDYVHSTKHKFKAKTVIIEPKRESLSYCYGNHLFSSIRDNYIPHNFVQQDDEVFLKFINPNYPDYSYLTKSRRDHYYLNNEPNLIKISDFQTRSKLYFYYGIGWAGESKKNNGLKEIIFLPSPDKKS